MIPLIFATRPTPVAIVQPEREERSERAESEEREERESAVAPPVSSSDPQEWHEVTTRGVSHSFQHSKQVSFSPDQER